MKWFLIALQKYADFSGRARRKEYWMFILFYVLFAFALGIMMGVVGASQSAAGLVNLVYLLGLFIPSISVGVRRMHDIGRSGWWLIVPFVGLIFCFFDSTPAANKYGPNPKGALAL